MKTHRIVIALVLAAAAVVAVMLLYRALRPEPRNSDTAVVRRGTIEATVEALGRVQAGREMDLSTQASGAVADVYVVAGDHVTAGTLLLKVDAREQLSAFQQAEHNLTLQQARLEDALRAPSAAQIDIARAKLRRATALRLNAQADYDEIADQPDAESSDEAVDLESAKLEYEMVQAEFDRLMEGTPESDLRQLRGSVEQAELSRDLAEGRLNSTRIYAPIDGTVMAVNAAVGQNVTGYSPLIRLADLSELVVVAEITELDIADVEQGQTVRIRLDAFPTEEMMSTIGRLPPGVGSIRGGTTYEASIALPESPLPIRAGMGANLTIVTHSVSDTLLVPRRAVRQAGRYQMVRVLEGRRTREVQVLTGLSNASEVEILSGLEEGWVVQLD